MRTTGNANINTRSYWNGIYGTVVKRAQYKSQGTNMPVKVEEGVYAYGAHTNRFLYALSQVKEGDKFLDIGCGVGVLTHEVHLIYPDAEVWGVDISDTAIKDNLKEDPDIHYIAGSVGQLEKIPNDYFDVVFAGEIIEHMNDPLDLVKDAYSKLKSGGIFIMTTPNTDHITSDEHTWIFEREDIEKLLKDGGFKSVEQIDLPDMEHLMVICTRAIK